MTDKDNDRVSDEKSPWRRHRSSAPTSSTNWTHRPPRAARARCPESKDCRSGRRCWSSSAGPNAGSRFLLDQASTSAGRHPDSDIFLDDVTVSRRHAEFRLESGEFQVVDVGSLNGTYVNREPVDSAVLANGDEVQIGKFRLVFLTGPKGDDGAAG